MQDYTEIINFLEEILAKVGSDLNDENKKTAMHYLCHNEYEMAFDSLFLGIMELEKKPELDWAHCMVIGKDLKLDQKSIFDFQFWDKLKIYAQIK